LHAVAGRQLSHYQQSTQVALGIVGTILLGMVGSLVGGFLGYLIFHKDGENGLFQTSGLIGSNNTGERSFKRRERELNSRGGKNGL